MNRDSTRTPDTEKESDPDLLCVSSTPMDTQPKMDVSALFQKMGSKLGWFEYKDLDSAINSLSNSAKKKKSTKQRRKKKDSTETDDGNSEESLQSRTKKERKQTKSKMSFSTETPLKKIHENCNNAVQLSDSLEDFKIPLRRTPASTDLTRNSGKKSLKKKTGKENVDEVFHKDTSDMKLSSHNSSCTEQSPKVHYKFEDYRNNRSKSTSPDSDNYDFGVPVQESTRIYSRASIDTILDIPNVSTESGKGLNLSENSFVKTRDNSYKQLNIPKTGKKRVSIGNFQRIEYKRDEHLSSKLQNLDLSNSDNSSGSTGIADVTDMYTTALCNTDSRETNKSRKSDTFYFDAKSTYSSSTSDNTELSSPDNPAESCSKSRVNEKSVDNSSEVSGSFYEVEDISVQTENVTGEKEQKSCKTHIDDSFDDSSLQKCKESEKCINDTDSESDLKSSSIEIITESSTSSSSYIEVQDTSTQAEGEEIQTENTSQTSDSKNRTGNMSQTSDSKNRTGNMSQTADSKNKTVNTSQTSDSKNRTVYFDTESNVDDFDMDGLALNNEKEGLHSGLQSNTENQHNHKSQSISFSSDEEDNFIIDKKKHEAIKSFDSSSDDDDVFSFKTPKLVMKKTTTKTTNSVTINSSDENDSKVKVGDSKKESEFDKKANSAQNVDRMVEIISSDDESFKDAVDNSKVNWRSQKKYDSESSDDDQLETFFQKMKTQKKESSEEEQDEKMDDFVVEDWKVEEINSSSDDDAFYITTTQIMDSKRSERLTTDFSSSESEEELPGFSSTDTDSEEEELPVIQKPRNRPQKTNTGTVDKERKPRADNLPVNDLPRKPRADNYPVNDHPRNLNKEYIPKTSFPVVKKSSFLKSLTKNLPKEMYDPAALRFVNNFSKTKEELTVKLFKLYNETVFDNKLPEDMPIIWNKRLLKTAGYCVYQKSVKNGTLSMSVRVELSTKVCDSAERTRDTLIHELCHAAVWLINGVNGGHGPYWKYWARKANTVYPELPIVKRCHSYSIETKYIYQCVKCKYQIGRHSKSLDTKRKVCGHCRGEFILLNRSGKPLQSTGTSSGDTPRTPNKFAMFVKENYKDIKSRDKSLKHGDVMSILSKEFAKQKLS